MENSRQPTRFRWKLAKAIEALISADETTHKVEIGGALEVDGAITSNYNLSPATLIPNNTLDYEVLPNHIYQIVIENSESTAGIHNAGLNVIGHIPDVTITGATFSATDSSIEFGYNNQRYEIYIYVDNNHVAYVYQVFEA